MHSLKLGIICIIGLTLMLSCNKEENLSIISPPTSSSSFQILPLGDSRVEGHDTAFESYRYELWKKLKERGLDIDFLGSETDHRTYPDFQNGMFDPNHEGHGGARTDQVLERVNTLISSNPESIGNVVLLCAGGNDLLEAYSASSAISNINEIIDALQMANNSITIFIEKIAAGTTAFNHSNEVDLAEFESFNNLISDVAANQSTSISKVIVVDMSNLLDDSDYADDVHYNNSGAEKIARQYFMVMDNELF